MAFSICQIIYFILFCAEDEIIIDSIALLKKGEEWSDSVYTLQGMNMDGVSTLLLQLGFG